MPKSETFVYFTKITAATYVLNSYPFNVLKFAFYIFNSNSIFRVYSLVLLLISNLTNGLRLHQFLMSKTTEVNKSLKTDANGAHLKDY